jgi:KaiC/GvpD/RAD55 family RecA-like ATPase
LRTACVLKGKTFKGTNGNLKMNNIPTPEQIFSGDIIESLKAEPKENSDSEPVSNTPTIKIPTAPDFLRLNLGDIDWLVEDLIPSGGRALVVAKRESYKTWLALHIAKCITEGLPLWGAIPTHKSKVLYISNDDPARSFQKRLDVFNFNGDLFIYHPALPNFSIEQDNGSFESVKELVEKEEIGMVIVDILRNTHNRDSNTDKDSKIVLEKFKELKENTPNLVIIFLIHPSKEQVFEKRFSRRQSEEAVGSYYWEAAVDTVLSLTKTVEEDVDQVVITVTKNKQSEERIKPFIGIRRKGSGPVEFIYEESVPDKLKIEQANEYILQVLEEKSYTRQQIIELVVASKICGPRLVEEALKGLKAQKLIVHTSTKPHIYSLVIDEPVEDSANRNGIYEVQSAETLTQPELLYREEANGK